MILLYTKKAPLNSPHCPFRGVFIQEDLTKQRSKLLKFLKAHVNTEKIKNTEGRIHVTLKENRCARRNITVENPDDSFKIGFDVADITQFGYLDM